MGRVPGRVLTKTLAVLSAALLGGLLLLYARAVVNIFGTFGSARAAIVLGRRNEAEFEADRLLFEGFEGNDDGGAAGDGSTAAVPLTRLRPRKQKKKKKKKREKRKKRIKKRGMQRGEHATTKRR